MIVRCANCHTEFSLDDRQVGPEGATVRCSVCAYVFRVDPLTATGLDQPWQIRTIDDLLFTAPDLLTLRQWIEEGRLHPDDQVSRTGRHWLRLGDMPEFSTVFQGFQGLPEVLTPVGGSPGESDSEGLGPPPAFGTTAESSSSGNRPPPQPVASSMLEAVTRRVQPVTTPVEDLRSSSGLASTNGKPSEASPSPSWEDRKMLSVAEGSQPIGEVVGRRSRMPWIYAAVGIAAGVGLVFGVPPVRERLFGAAETVVGDEQVAAPIVVPELDAARSALARLDPAAIGRAEASLQSRLDEGNSAPGEVAAMKLAQAELLAVRSLEYQIEASFAEGTSAQSQASEYAARASRAFDSVPTDAVSDRSWLKRTRAVLRLVEGRPADEIMALLPDGGADELRLWVEAASLWRDPRSTVPDNLIGRLRALDPPSMLSRLLLALSYIRSGDKAGAGQVLDAALRDVPGQPTAVALARVASGSKPEPTTVEDVGSEPMATAKSAGTRPDVAAGLSIDRMIERGCSKVESGDAAGGLVLLLRAHDMRPGDLDLLVCLGDGKSKQGQSAAALSFYERALKQSPRYRSALLGAAQVSAKTGQTSKAASYYKRLLEVDPSNSVARTYVSQHSAPESDPTSAPASRPPG